MRAQSAPGFPCALSKERGTTRCTTRAKTCRGNENVCFLTVIASEAKQSSFAAAKKAGLLRRFAPRNDGGETRLRPCRHVARRTGRTQRLGETREFTKQ